MSALEVYCENVRDLFQETEGVLLKIRFAQQKVQIENQCWRRVTNCKELLELIQLSASKRTFANNGQNEHSSRSHHIFQIKMLGQNKLHESTESLLSIVDLAGSERRIDNLVTEQTSVNSKKRGTTSKEATKGKGNDNRSSVAANKKQLEQEQTFINKSLSTLGRVFTILADRKSHKKQLPPYRDSKLTRILQDSLTYDSPTLMIATICCGLKSIAQTKETLSFATQAMLSY